MNADNPWASPLLPEVLAITIKRSALEPSITKTFSPLRTHPSLFFSALSSVFAGSCPMMAKNLDAKIAEAQQLRDAGMKAHDNGEHKKSVDLLNKALEMFKG